MSAHTMCVISSLSLIRDEDCSECLEDVAKGNGSYGCYQCNRLYHDSCRPLVYVHIRGSSVRLFQGPSCVVCHQEGL